MGSEQHIQSLLDRSPTHIKLLDKVVGNGEIAFLAVNMVSYSRGLEASFTLRAESAVEGIKRNTRISLIRLDPRLDKRDVGPALHPEGLPNRFGQVIPKPVQLVGSRIGAGPGHNRAEDF